MKPIFEAMRKLIKAMDGHVNHACPNYALSHRMYSAMQVFMASEGASKDTPLGLFDQSVLSAEAVAVSESVKQCTCKTTFALVEAAIASQDSMNILVRERRAFRSVELRIEGLFCDPTCPGLVKTGDGAICSAFKRTTVFRDELPERNALCLRTMVRVINHPNGEKRC